MSSFNFQKYKAALCKAESKCSYTATNQSGALGKYQFMPSTLTNLKFIYDLPDWKNANYFLSNPELQELYFFSLVASQLDSIAQNNLNVFYGRTVTGSKRFKHITTKINVYGMLAAMHLSGAGNVIKFFQTGYDPNDGYTSLSDYMAYFSKELSNNDNYLIYLLAFIPAIVLYYS